jgi:hypothetical protein
MKAYIKSLLVGTCSALAVALLTFSFTLRTASIVRADDPEALAAARPEMVLVSAKALEGLEQRVSYLEGVVASLTESSQHLSTQLCVSDESGAETCLTKSQLDALLTSQARGTEAAQSTPLASAETTPVAEEPPAVKEPPTAKEEPVAIPATNPEPAPAAANETPRVEPETTGSISTAAAPTAPVIPDTETQRPDDLP